MPARNTTEEAAHQKSRCGAGDRRSQPCSISWPKGARLTCEIDEGIRRGERRGIGRGGNGGVWVGEPSSQDPRLPRVVAQAPRTSTNRPLIQRPCALFSCPAEAESSDWWGGRPPVALRGGPTPHLSQPSALPLLRLVLALCGLASHHARRDGKRRVVEKSDQQKEEQKTKGIPEMTNPSADAHVAVDRPNIRFRRAAVRSASTTPH